MEVWLDDPLSWRLTRSEPACVETEAESTCDIWKARRMVGKILVIFMLGGKLITKSWERSVGKVLLGVSEMRREEGILRK